MSRLRNILVRLSAAVSAVVVLVGGSLILAQPSADPAPDTAPVEPVADPAPLQDNVGSEAEPPPEVTLPMTKQADLSVEEMQSGAKEALEELRAMLGRMVELREVARQSGDIIKLTCVNDQLLLHKQVVNLAEGSQTELVEAVAQENVDEQKHQYGQVVLAKEKGSTILNDAEGCIGDEIVHLGPTEVSLDAPPIDNVDDNQFPDWDPPVYASPFN